MKSRVKYNDLISVLVERSYCVWDVSECSNNERKAIENWCIDENYSFNTLDKYEDYIMLAHPHFSVGGYGVMMPGALTWEEFDSFDMNSIEIISNIPFGKKASRLVTKEIKSKYIDDMGEHIDEYILQQEDALQGEPLNHSERTIIFIAYVYPANKDKILFEIENLKKLILFENHEKELYLNDEYHDNIADLVLKINPTPEVLTFDIV